MTRLNIKWMMLCLGMTVICLMMLSLNSMLETARGCKKFQDYNDIRLSQPVAYGRSSTSWDMMMTYKHLKHLKGSDVQFNHLLGNPRLEKGFLTIGIPTVSRKNGTYLIQTIQSLIDNLDQEYLGHTSLVIFSADFGISYSDELIKTINSSFPDYVTNGFIEIIAVPQSAYPPLQNLKQTFGDPSYRVEWRSKQNVDYSLLMLYCADKSKYYLHLEDDVSTVPHYVRKIQTYIEQVKQNWAMLEFSSLGFIGKLFHSEDTGQFSTLLWTFYAEMPCDFLFQYFLDIKLQSKRLVRIPTLFQHHGMQSSLPNFTRNVSDMYFLNEAKVHKGDNPAASLFTSMRIYERYTPDRAYGTGDMEGNMWIINPQPGDTMTIVFHRQQTLKRVIIETGFPGSGRDMAKAAILEASSRFLQTKGNNDTCIAYRIIGEFKSGKVDILGTNLTYHHGETTVRCLRLTITSEQTEWLLVREIAIFTNSPANITQRT